ncbi:MAG: c-type cytochrome, partial [Planctomycetia bacterium]|nr:c-type cytochrome [Planctomycetia bacterium]
MPLRRTGAGFLAMIVAALGCQKAPEPAYVSSPPVLELSAELQQQVHAALEEHCGTYGAPKLLGENRPPRELARAAALYAERCEACHGATGDGAGPAAKHLDPKPRDYRRGEFKFTSTEPGAKALRADLVRTVRQGVKGTSMPSFSLLPDEDIEALVDHVLVLTYRGELETQLALLAQSEEEINAEGVSTAIEDALRLWKKAPQQVLYPPRPVPPATKESIERGKQAFLSAKANCVKCHLENGRGTLVENQKDAWGYAIRPADLTSGMLHGGNEPDDIYRRVYAGVKGGRMPDSRLQFPDDPQTVWDLVHYVEQLSNERRRDTLAAQSRFARKKQPPQKQPPQKQPPQKQP